jgi:hypothetical protein
VRPDRRAGYLGDVDWDSNWEPIVSSNNEDSDKDKDNDEEEEECEEEADVKMPPPPCVNGEVYGQIYNGRVIHDDTDDMIHHVVYHYFQAADCGDAYQMPPELTEEEELAAAVLNSEEERRAGRRAFPELTDALVLSVAPLPLPGPPPMQPPRIPLATPRREARAEPWDAWPGVAPRWPAGAPPILGWAPGTPVPHQGLHRRP